MALRPCPARPPAYPDRADGAGIPHRRQRWCVRRAVARDDRGLAEEGRSRRHRLSFGGPAGRPAARGGASARPPRRGTAQARSLAAQQAPPAKVATPCEGTYSAQWCRGAYQGFPSSCWNVTDDNRQWGDLRRLVVVGFVRPPDLQRQHRSRRKRPGHLQRDWATDQRQPELHRGHDRPGGGERPEDRGPGGTERPGFLGHHPVPVGRRPPERSEIGGEVACDVHRLGSPC